MSKIPFAAEDLTRIADALVAFNKMLENDPDTFIEIGRIEVLSHYNMNEVIGHIVACDDWYGFEPVVSK